jgi:hypothetical protein
MRPRLWRMETSEGYGDGSSVMGTGVMGKGLRLWGQGLWGKVFGYGDR